MFSERAVLVRVEKVRLKGSAGTTTNILKNVRSTPKGTIKNIPEGFFFKLPRQVPPKIHSGYSS